MRGRDFLQTHPEGGLYRTAGRKDGSPHCSMKERNTVWHTISLMVYRLLAMIAIMAKTKHQQWKNTTTTTTVNVQKEHCFLLVVCMCCLEQKILHLCLKKKKKLKHLKSQPAPECLTHWGNKNNVLGPSPQQAVRHTQHKKTETRPGQKPRGAKFP